ncbi:PREDICTED: delta(3,5)-Delta(2,4)-dienoyl-CoA isomerase, mitochondrial-like isoform X2 [Dipodomys ordii]|uniref:Delta(3,5)-Delta(2,4)-dienoyl-CoA isomerase, mitochondrial-like isoform X2 n=1 Tax=Dipodomys ordii TaxID=10020 RepID=A0A1S3G0G8_DIPOR|nr:PREDICTED: delta(3,5)-Delta(2,4)-dienoyl-CoA isomerase, mitochondrial-like isoform X2 [Dipodomys ordii]
MAVSRAVRDLWLRRLAAPTQRGFHLSPRPLSSSAHQASKAAPSEASDHSYESLQVTSAGTHVLHVQLNRPDKRNAMNKAFWREMVECFNKIARDSNCRAVVVSGAGKMFTSGIDLMDMASELLQPEGDDVARISWYLRDLITQYQKTFTVIEKVWTSSLPVTSATVPRMLSSRSRPLENEHAADPGHGEVSAGGHGKEGPEERHLLQTQRQARPAPGSACPPLC